MSWLLVAFLAQLVIGSAGIFDKLLLRRHTIEPWSYAFWFGVVGLAAAFLLPFGYQSTALPIIALALAGGAAFIVSALFFFIVLEKIEASEALPLLGAFSPIATLAVAAQFLEVDLNTADAVGFGFLIVSGALLFLVERREIGFRHAGMIALAAILLAVSHVAAKAVFAQTSFLTGFFWLKLGGALIAFLLLCSPGIRRKITVSEQLDQRTKLLYLLNRSYAAGGSLLISFAIFLATPALVDATQNLRFAITFILGWLVLGERFRGRVFIGKLVAFMLVTFGFGFLALGEYVRSLPPVPQNRPIAWGVTFSQPFARELGLDWRETYRAILDDLRPHQVRLIAYWDEVEPADNDFRFHDLDWQIEEAERRSIPYIIAIGMKTPRWPECHIPKWAASRDPAEQETLLFDYVRTTIERYRGRPGLKLWQVENEPLLWFGRCPVRRTGFLEREIALVRSLDRRHLILTTDGGEFGLWWPSSRAGDVFGTTMYRKVYPRFIGPVFGTIEYPLKPTYFRVKERFTRWWTARPGQRFLVSELQGEPWEPQLLVSIPLPELTASFSPEYFRETIGYARAAGFEEYYLWGAEWWWWMRQRHHESRYWNIARDLFRTP